MQGSAASAGHDRLQIFERLDRGLTVDHHGHDGAVSRPSGCCADHDPSPSHDHSIDHRVTNNLEQEQRPVPNDLLGQQEDLPRWPPRRGSGHQRRFRPITSTSTGSSKEISNTTSSVSSRIQADSRVSGRPFPPPCAGARRLTPGVALYSAAWKARQKRWKFSSGRPPHRISRINEG